MSIPLQMGSSPAGSRLRSLRAGHHGVGLPSLDRQLRSSTYPLLFPMLWVAYLLPALTGKVKQAQLFITSN